MSQGPRRLIEDPEWGAAFEGLRDEHGVIEGLPDDVRADVALMIAASVAGAVGVAAAGAAGASLASSGSTGVATGSVSSALAGGASSAAAATGSVAASSSVVASSGVLAGSSVAAVGSGVASAVGAATAAGTLGAASASLAALGVVPKVIAVLSLAGAMTVGGVAVVKNTQSRTQVVVPAAENELQAGPGDVPPGETTYGRKKTEANRLSAAPVRGPRETGVAAHEVHSHADTEKAREGESKSVPEAQPAVAKAGVPTGLAGEVSLLGRARAALSTNREYAWTLLTEYHRRYPEGALRAEYETLVRRVQTAPGSEPAAVPAAEVR